MLKFFLIRVKIIRFNPIWARILFPIDYHPYIHLFILASFLFVSLFIFTGMYFYGVYFSIYFCSKCEFMPALDFISFYSKNKLTKTKFPFLDCGCDNKSRDAWSVFYHSVVIFRFQQISNKKHYGIEISDSHACLK